jgi:DNA-binding LacI/PurR family transcriptional regulator
MYELTKWVIGRGKRRVLTLWNGSTQEGWVRGRLRGYEKAMREAGLEAMEAVEMPRVQASGERQFEAASRLAAGYLAPYLNGANPVDAIMAGSDGEAAAIGGACRILGREVMVVGYGNEGGSVEDGENPMAATVDRKRVEMGRELVKLLMERIGGKLPQEGQRRVVRPEVVVLEEAGKGEEKPTEPQVEPPVLMSVLQQEREGENKPLFGWKMEGGRWMLGKKGGGKK